MKIYFTKEAISYSKSEEILKRVDSYEIVEDEEEFIKTLKEKNLNYKEEKKYILFALKKGKFLKKYYLDKRFKGIKEEYYLSYENNCIFNCDYCYLRDYFGHGATVFYVNLEDMFAELDCFNEKATTISCGIVNDSLAINKITHVIEDLLGYFKNRPDINLEIRTKASNILPFNHQYALNNVIIAFSLNPEKYIQKYEFKTSSLQQRVQNIAKLQEIGYNIGLRIDPLIYGEDWEKEYTNMIKYIFNHINLKKIKNIGIGCLRYKKGLKEKIGNEIDTDIFYNEIITGIDGKEKYFKGIRVKMFKKIIREIRKYGNYEIYLGMETENVWEQSGL